MTEAISNTIYKATQMFFAEIQDKLLYAVTHKTAAELVLAREMQKTLIWH